MVRIRNPRHENQQGGETLFAGLRDRPTYANVMATVAVFIALAFFSLALLARPLPVEAASCGTVVASDGFRAAAITTKRLSCSRGRSVLRRWLADHGRPIDGPRGWDCAYGSSGRWRCTRSGAVLAFTYYADEA